MHQSTCLAGLVVLGSGLASACVCGCKLIMLMLKLHRPAMRVNTTPGIVLTFSRCRRNVSKPSLVALGMLWMLMEALAQLRLDVAAKADTQLLSSLALLVAVSLATTRQFGTRFSMSV